MYNNHYFNIIVVLLCVKNSRYDEGMKDVFKQNQCIEISKEPLMIITERENAVQIFLSFMENDGWIYLKNEQLGSQYCFKNNTETIYFILTYNKSYALWTKR